MIFSCKSYSGLQKELEQTDNINISCFLNSLESMFYSYCRFIITWVSTKNIHIFDSFLFCRCLIITWYGKDKQVKNTSYFCITLLEHGNSFCQKNPMRYEDNIVYNKLSVEKAPNSRFSTTSSRQMVENRQKFHVWDSISYHGIVSFHSFQNIRAVIITSKYKKTTWFQC